jgi:hypothetical protein
MWDEVNKKYVEAVGVAMSATKGTALRRTPFLLGTAIRPGRSLLGGATRRAKMFRLQSLMFAAILISSAAAFAADTPDPNASGAAGLPSGSNAASPPSAADGSGMAESKKDVPAMTPGQENKSKAPNPQ